MKKLMHVAALTLIGALAASAGVISLVTSRATLAGNDFIDWGQLGPDFTDVSSPATVTSHLGLGPDTVSASTSPDIFSVQQGNSWGGDFSNGDNLLYMPDGGTLTIAFASAIQGAGMQFQSATFGSFTASISAFGAGNVLFGTVTRTGTSSNASDGSAIFLGLTSSAKDIVSLQLHVTIPGPSPINDPNGFAVNRMDLRTTAVGPTVPEPSVVSMLAGGAFLVFAARRRLKR